MKRPLHPIWQHEALKDQLEVLRGQRVVVFDHTSFPDMPKEDFSPDFYILILCDGGKATCTIENKTYEIGLDDVLVTHPNQFIEHGMTSLDFRFRGLLVSPEYLENMLLLGNSLWEVKKIIHTHPLLHLSDVEARRFKEDIHFLQQKLQPPFGAHHREMLDLLLQSFIFDFYDFVSSKLEIDQPNYSSANALFNRFLEMAVRLTPAQREVRHYARSLCVSPKYLSAICKHEAGLTASEIINQLTVKTVKHLLRSTDKSVKQIAYETGFSNLSFFGKYVKRELGLSPRAYRKQCS